jgi:hypothetical protein
MCLRLQSLGIFSLIPEASVDPVASMMVMIRQGVELRKTSQHRPRSESPSAAATASTSPDGDLNQQLEAALKRINKQCASVDEDEDDDEEEEQDFGE